MGGDTARNRGDEMVAPDAVARFDMVILENHLTGCSNACRMDGGCATSGFGDLTGGTEKMVTGCAGNIVSAWK